MTNNRKTIVAVYDSHAHAKDAVEALHAGGFTKEEISLVAGNAGDHNMGATGHGADHHEGNKAGKGAVTGGVLGGIAGLLLGLAGMTVPGIGPVVAAGPLSTALGGAAAGALAGGIIGGLIGMGIPEEDAHIYAEGVRRGSTIVAVTTQEGRVDEATHILDRFNPIDIDERAASWKNEGWSRFDESAQPLKTQPMPQNLNHDIHAGQNLHTGGQKEVIPVVKEELAVGKRESHNPVRVRSYVMSTPVQESVTLREEHVNVERHAVDRPLTNAAGVFEEKTVVVDEMTEQAVIGKQAKVVEEIVVNKEATERVETVRDEVRHTEVEIDRDASIAGNTTNPGMTKGRNV